MIENDSQFKYDKNLKALGFWFLGRFFYYKWNLKKSLIVLDSLLSKTRKLVNFISFCIAGLGWFAFFWWVYENKEFLIANPVNILSFWQVKHPLILIFLISLIFDLFLYYRTSVEKQNRIKISNKDFKLEDSGQFKKKISCNVTKLFNDEAKKVFEEAFLLAKKLKQKEVSCLHLFRVLLRVDKIQAIFLRLNIDFNSLVVKLDKHLLEDDDVSNKTIVSEFLSKLTILSTLNAVYEKRVAVDVLDLFAFCYEEDSVLGEILYDFNINKNKMINIVKWLRIDESINEGHKSYHQAASLKPGNNMNRAYTAIATPTLDHFSADLTLLARANRFDICIARNKEFTNIFETLGSGHSGVLLIGENGVGKRTIIEGLAQLMVRESVPKFLSDKRLVELDVSRLVAGASPAEAQDRLLSCIYEVNRAKNIILYIENIENLMGISSGTEESLDVSEVLAEALGKQALFCLASVSRQNYSKFIEGKALGEIMTTVLINEPEVDHNIQILESKVSDLESRYNVYITYSALEATVKLANKYLHDTSSPLKTVNLLQKAVTYSARKSKNNNEKVFCGSEEVALAIEEITGIPANKISEDESHKLLNLEKDIHVRMIGQEEAVSAVSASLRRARVELKDSARPIASFLFLGPTGVGKTELAKTVSEVYFGDEKYMIRIDMSEYQNPDSVDKMIGNQNGVLGYLTEAVRKKPFSLILLDEIEKAHPDILNLFLQLLDDGRLTDGQGRTISFSESIIIATSNIGSVLIQEKINSGVDVNLIKQDLIDNQLNKYMRPELINRFDGIIVFKPLTEENISAIAILMLKKIKKNLAEKGINFKADIKGVNILAKQGYDPKFGARPLRRLLQEKVEDQIANLLLAQKIKRRDAVFIDYQGKIGVEKGRDL